MLNTLASFLMGLLMILSSGVQAQSLMLSDAGRYELKTFISHLRDSSNGRSFHEIVTDTTFTSTQTINYGFDNATHWFSFEVENHSHEKEWLLEIAFSPLDKIEFYFPEGSRWVKKTSGDNYLIAIREVFHPHPVFIFPIDSGETKKCFLKIQTTSSVQLPAILWKADNFYRSNFSIQIFNGLFYGALIIMIIYQLFLFVSTRDKISLYYVFTLLAMVHVVAYFQGYSFLYLYPRLPQLNHYMAVFTGPFFLFFSTWLTRTFLNLKETNPWLDRLLLLNLVIDVAGAFFLLFFLDTFSYRIHHYAILLHCFLALIAAADSIYRKFRPALFYFLSWLTLLICAFVFSLSNLGLFRKYLITDANWLIIGCVLQMLFISFAIGNRWIILTRENQISKEAALRRGQKEREKLEKEVRLRTEEIQTKSQKLEEVNLIKDKLFSVVSHDIKGPLTSLQLALGLIRNDTINEKEFRELAQILETRFKQTTEFIENMLQWASLQLKGITFDPTPLQVHQIGQTTFSLLDYEVKNKGISTHNNVDESLFVFADVNMVRSIMRNLVMNAIKFTGKDGTITINAKRAGRFVTVSVRDTGIGIPEANRDKLFSLDGVTTPGTKEEKGTGLGLLLCKEFVERNNGKIWLETKEGVGTTFYFDLPVYEHQQANELT